MIQELYCYFDLDKRRCYCGADGKDRSHEECKYHLGSDNGRPCAHFRPDHAGACDNAYACFEAYANSIKPEQQKGDQK